MKVTLLLRNDHAVLQNLLASLKSAIRQHETSNKNDLLDQMQDQARLHSLAESEILFPALQATASDRASDLMSAAQAGHRDIEVLLRELISMNPSDRHLERKLDVLIDEVHRHIQLDEDDVFREARLFLTELRLEELGIAAQRMRNANRRPVQPVLQVGSRSRFGAPA